MPNYKFSDLRGRVFGRLTVGERQPRSVNAAPAGQRSRRYVHWNVTCACGRKKVVNGHYLRNGHVKACGTCKSELTAFQVTRTFERWWRVTGIPENTIRARLHAGWSPEAAVSTFRWGRRADAPPSSDTVLAQALADLGISAAELGRALGISRKRLWWYVRSPRPVTPLPAVALAIADHLGLDLADLFPAYA